MYTLERDIASIVSSFTVSTVTQGDSTPLESSAHSVVHAVPRRSF